MSAYEQIADQQVLTFRLGNETFAVPVTEVREILDSPPITRIPQTPEFFAGVINLRGQVVPVITLRRKFGLASLETLHSCIVVLEIDLDGTLTQFGVLVDGVQEVAQLRGEQIEPPPRLGVGLKLDYLAGVGKLDDRFILLLNVSRLLSGGEVQALQTLQEYVDQTKSALG